MKRKWVSALVGNECVDALAEYQACHGNINPADTTIRTAGHSGNPSFNASWLPVEEVQQQGYGNETPQHGTRLSYLPILQAA